MNDQRISKLKEHIECILNYCYYVKFIPFFDRNKYQDIPENEQIVGESTRKIIGIYTFKEYMDNKIENHKPKKGDELAKQIIIMFRDIGHGYQIFPDNILSDEYIIELDEGIKSMIYITLKFINSDYYNKIKDEDENEDESDNYEEENSTKIINNVTTYILKQLFLDQFYCDFIKYNDRYHCDVIKPTIDEIYNIKDICDEK